MTKLSFATLNDLSNGAVGEAVDEAIRQVLADILARGKDGQSRKIILQVIVNSKPSGGKLSFTARPTVQAVLPLVKPIKTHGWIEVQSGTAEGLFNPTSAKNPDQLSFDDLEE